jgi:hypothetical protein
MVRSATFEGFIASNHHAEEIEEIMDAQKTVKKATEENPDIALVLEISARAREIEQREPAMDLRPTADVSANPATAQGSIHCSGYILTD